MVNEEETIVKEETLNKEKKKKDNGEKSLFSRIMNIVLWVILFAWMAIVLVDFIEVRKENDPKFCFINNHTITYDDGSVEECYGLGYKVIKYNRESLKAIEFGPFWISEKTPEEV
jgi:hypothetical protein